MAEDRAIQAERLITQEREKSDKFMAKLRELGINPDDI